MKCVLNRTAKKIRTCNSTSFKSASTNVRFPVIVEISFVNQAASASSLTLMLLIVPTVGSPSNLASPITNINIFSGKYYYLVCINFTKNM